MVTIIQGTTKKPVSSQQLASFFAEREEYEGFLYIGYPIIGTAEGPYPIDALLLSRTHGLVVFSLIEGRDTADFDERQDDSYNKLESKLRAHKSLMNGRNLQVPIFPVTFAPTLDDTTQLSTADHPLCNDVNLEDWLETCEWDDPDYFEALVAVIQAISTIRKGRKKRDVKNVESRGAKLKQLEDSIANLDNLQGRAVIETVEGVQRIRGLAGSGKTIVLALKAAYLHAQHPEWKIAVTFNTRSLKGQFRQLINTFTIEQTNEEPDWENLQIIHAWGAPGGGDRDGLYYKFCQTHGAEYYDFGSAKRTFGQTRAFAGACETALQKSSGGEAIYDAILVDEAQDFPPAFLTLCYELLSEEKRLVYAYDELQNLSSQSLPSPEKIFGLRPDGTPKVRLAANQPGQPQQDVILEKCYRNSRPVLVTAHALGFGIYRPPDADTGTGLVQIFDHNELWLEVGYEIAAGELVDGHQVQLARTSASSPKFLEAHSHVDDLIQFHCFASREEQDQWVANAIHTNLTQDELRFDDIIVINPDPLSTRDAVSPIRKRLFEAGINSHLAGVDTTPDVFFDTDRESVAFTGIFRAKGNEAGMVYIINAQDCYSSFGNLATIRNRLFTAITRSKAWVRVLGVGKGMEALKQEFDEVKANEFTLRFKYPTENERKHINIVNRDMTEEERRRVKRKKDDLAQLLDDLEKGRVFAEDLGAEQLQRLRTLINRE
ncbi:MAG: ATP-binding domain-containing protein [Candidatus Thiodiazotropha lotti]|nr:ATP-binding domain-containing protein [Candidatus Thiodiazotropha lotti]MCW4219793.1 ATP-binding domain-containing protein [Candidatus Thiodiazotropha lotti]